jgi:O-palmitoleoyl-L-serine hydrolase
VRPYQLHKHKAQSTEALCLDGSLAGVYFSPGNGTRKTVVYFEGGGWCSGLDSDSVLESCYYRAKTDLGSSNNWKLQDDYDYVFRANPDKDVFFSDWNKFVIKYCDGGRHQSYQKDPIQHKDAKLYFRGHSNTIAALRFVEKMLPLELTTDFVLQGCSAGALSTFAWTDYFMDYVRSKNSNIKYWALPDSAFYVDYKSLKTKDYDYKLEMKALYSTLNDPSVPFPQADCVNNYAAEAYKCFLTEYMFPFIRSPLFVIQSGYDSFQIPNVLQSKCQTLSNCSADDLQDIHTYHKYQQ